MTDPTSAETDVAPETPADEHAEDPTQGLTEDSLVEEISIDGMCGVY